ncbi:MAG TPA: asparagine synthetase B [Candidatus Kapabacteria bacterium]|nr:asparagine synthetase B [Candidatus Kapabacteria bacterium]
MKYCIYILIFFALSMNIFSQKILIPMDLAQTDHLKPYGLMYWVLKNGGTADWLLNYRGGSFLLDYSDNVATECRIRGIFFEQISESSTQSILATVNSENSNMESVKLEKAPKIAVYVPPGSRPWDDAVRLALEYAEVDYAMIWDEDVMTDKLKEYDWLHLHHEDFTGQNSKFWVAYRNAPWYIQQVALNESMAKKLGFPDVCELKKGVAKKIREYVANGGFLFAMCTATDSYDIALSVEHVDICDVMYDGTPYDHDANNKLHFDETFAFENFKLILDPTVVEFSDIDIGMENVNNPDADYFSLFNFSAKYDPVPTMLTQDHVNMIKGFMGQTTAFKKSLIKPSVTILAMKEGTEEVKYIHGNVGRGTYTWLGGHDPEDYTHRIGDPPTDLNLFKNSPGYRLILNNILFPAAKKKKQKT